MGWSIGWRARGFVVIFSCLLTHCDESSLTEVVHKWYRAVRRERCSCNTSSEHCCKEWWIAKCCCKRNCFWLPVGHHASWNIPTPVTLHTSCLCMSSVASVWYHIYCDYTDHCSVTKGAKMLWFALTNWRKLLLLSIVCSMKQLISGKKLSSVTLGIAIDLQVFGL